MKREIRGFIVGVIITTMLSGVAFAAGTYQNINVLLNAVNVVVNGQNVATDNLIYNDRTYVPLRAVSEILGKEVIWDGPNNTVNINDKGSNPQPPSVSYTRVNPAPLGTTQRIIINNIFDNFTAEVIVKEAIRGDKAWQQIKAANMFNDPPGSDEDYILAKIAVNAVAVDGGKSLEVTTADFDVYSGSDALYNGFFSVVTPEPALSTQLYPGAQHEGYIAFKVKKSDMAPKVAYKLNYDGTGGIWFKLQ